MEVRRQTWRISIALAFLLAGAGSLHGAEYAKVGFDQLAAKEYDPLAPEGRKKVVRKDRAYLERHVLDEVLALDGKRVEIAGYMLPLSADGGIVKEFLLMPDTGACCFGVMPAYNEFVNARYKKGSVLLHNVPIRIQGKLTVEEVWQGGFFSHLYFVEVDEIVVKFGATAP